MSTIHSEIALALPIHSELALALPVALFLSTMVSWKCLLLCRRSKTITTSDERSLRTSSAGSTLDALIGNTPLIKLNRLSDITGCDIFVKVCGVSLGGFLCTSLLMNM